MCRYLQGGRIDSWGQRPHYWLFQVCLTCLNWNSFNRERRDVCVRVSVYLRVQVGVSNGSERLGTCVHYLFESFWGANKQQWLLGMQTEKESVTKLDGLTRFKRETSMVWVVQAILTRIYPTTDQLPWVPWKVFLLRSPSLQPYFQETVQLAIPIFAYI